MDLVTSFVELLQQVAFVFTTPTFSSLLTVLTGWVFARRRGVTRPNRHTPLRDMTTRRPRLARWGVDPADSPR